MEKTICIEPIIEKKRINTYLDHKILVIDTNTSMSIMN